MKIKMSRRIVAVLATSGLLLAAAPALAPAQAADACALGATCEGSLTGSLGSSTFKIVMPTTFNGTVLLFSHGYRVGTPVPAALATPLGFAANPAYVKTSVPAFAATFGTDVAYVGGGGADVADNPLAIPALLAQGYALAGTGYAKQGWATAEGVESGENLLKYINAGAIKGVKKTMVWGESLGGLIAQTIAERNPGKIAGSLPTCAPLAGPEQAFSGAMTVMYTWKTLIAPTLRVANYQSYTQALSDLGTVLTTLGGVAAGTVSTSAVGYPVAQANLLAGLMAGLPTKSTVYDGQTVNPAYATLGTLAAVVGGYSPASAGANSAAAMLQNVGGAAALGILGRYELEQRARAIASIPATTTANFNDNINVSYTNLLSSEQRGEFGDTLNASTVMPNLLNAMLAKLDASKGDATARFGANAAAVAAVRALPAAKGVYSVPTLLISTTYDSIVAAGNTSEFYAKLAKSGAKSKLLKIAQYYTVPSPDGYTKFAAGGKSPDAAASAAANTSGVGHCTFFGIAGGAQITNAITTLNAMVNAKTASALKKAKAIEYATAGVNNDGQYEPDALKRPNAK